MGKVCKALVFFLRIQQLPPISDRKVTYATLNTRTGLFNNLRHPLLMQFDLKKWVDFEIIVGIPFLIEVISLGIRIYSEFPSLFWEFLKGD